MGVKLLATVDYETGHIVWQEDEQYTAETFPFPFFKSTMGDLSNRETGSGFGQCPDSSCKAASAVSEIRLRVGQFMDEIMKHPHAIIDRLCVRL
ncbi:hypothetical protein [Paenibacillus larvae]|uniref:hypothetical protein n=1 Tax=Paenibacillus larvae TaxID=1464 RepID=UPI002890FF3A|nr:hypothetical protein [Paenibacillus larvae]MDT2193743.1 hypothetical protein [Paenibacillus larvae]